MVRPKTGLGRGLDALIPGATANAIEEVDITLIRPNPQQPRMGLDSVALQELTASIRQHGILQPLLVSQDQSAEGQLTYQLIAGERRWQAAKLAGLATVPVVIRETTLRESLELALVENLQRTDLQPLEAAGAYRRLMDEFGLSQEEVAAKVGKSRTTIANSLRLLGLPQAIKDALASAEITEGHARALLGLPDEMSQRSALAQILARGLSVRQTEQLVRRWVAPEAATTVPEAVVRDPDLDELEQRLRAVLGTKVQLLKSPRSGRLVIYFFSDEELQNICDIIMG